MKHDHGLKKLNFDKLIPSPGSAGGWGLWVGGSAGKIFGTAICCCNRDSLQFDLQHDHVLKK